VTYLRRLSGALYQIQSDECNSTVRILCWNIRHGGGSRASLVAERIIDQNPDIAIVTEFRNNQAGKALKRALADAGLTHAASPDAMPNCNTVLVASNSNFKTDVMPSLGPESYRVICAKFNDLVLFGFYFPGNNAKRPIFEVICDLNSKYLAGKSLLIGDFNTGRHYLDEQGATFIAAEYFDKLEGKGWIDSWRSRNPESREFSWLSQIGNGFRIDHAFASPSLNSKITNIQYSHQVRLDGISDHSMLLLDLEFPAMNNITQK
jgi:exodeoxyribonuclease-3